MEYENLEVINGDIENVNNIENGCNGDCENCSDCDETNVESAEEIMGSISVQEELKRIEIQDNPIESMPEEYKNDKYVQEMMKKIHIIGTGFQTLIGYGLDYNNAVAITSNLITMDEETKRSKIKSEVVEQNL